MENEIKLVAVDLDGTLLNSKHEMSAANEAALKAVIEKGVPVILATGKTRASAESLIEKLSLTTLGVYNQGLMIYNGDGTVQHQQTLDPAIARQALTFAGDRGFGAVAISGTRILIASENDISKKLQEYGEPSPEVVGTLQNILADVVINKLLFFGEKKKIKALRWQLGMQLDGQISLTQAQIPTMLEMLPPGASKGKALMRVMKELNTPPENTLAIGDGENDIEMVKVAGVGVAVENAAASLKEVADHVVASNDADGVAEALKRFVLKDDATEVKNAGVSSVVGSTTKAEPEESSE